MKSTADIAILTAPRNVTCDIYKRYVNSEVARPKWFHMSEPVMCQWHSLYLHGMGMKYAIDIVLLAFTATSPRLFIPTIVMVCMADVSKGAAFWSVPCLSLRC